MYVYCLFMYFRFEVLYVHLYVPTSQAFYTTQRLANVQKCIKKKYSVVEFNFNRISVTKIDLLLKTSAY